MRRALLALVSVLVLGTGVAMATPVSVLTLADEGREILAPLDDGEPLEYSYEQSVYLVRVFEEFERTGDRLELLRVRSSDIRAVEYFRWDGEIRQGTDGLFTQDAPPSEVIDLVIRITPGRGQTMRTPRWTRGLEAIFGDGVVRVRVERRPFLATVLSR
ncbi:MAG: hypothetical protein ACRDF9_12045 [Candidatus Limnocylindria bacterium]